MRVRAELGAFERVRVEGREKSEIMKEIYTRRRGANSCESSIVFNDYKKRAIRLEIDGIQNEKK